MVDDLLLHGVTRKHLLTVTMTHETHVYHLRHDHGLPIAYVDGLYRFDRKSLEVMVQKDG
ncbi:hypothetical protein [Fimbriiglobus ruber]|uniref:Uncharacterized protein n=1 Tax=Fimbriiglobus ruber TaxID=1908690 RepID=A0A225DRZ5_9BACT|nr:hypothetical protein [Fimbriiglobus ruber]OWK39929.1 hypothetical protein FRUB_05819 [Fimbriiglobus ruber]